MVQGSVQYIRTIFWSVTEFNYYSHVTERTQKLQESGISLTQ